jgi:ribonuclease HI
LLIFLCPYFVYGLFLFDGRPVYNVDEFSAHPVLKCPAIAQKPTQGFVLNHENIWTVYTDGGCAPSNPGPAGWGVVCQPPAGAPAKHGYGFIGPGTNQIAELTAAIEGLRTTPAGAAVKIVSDSQYVLKGISEWRKGWERRGWKNSKGEPVANSGLWKSLFVEVDARKVQVQWVRGHNGHPQNELADELAGKALATRSTAWD